MARPFGQGKRVCDVPFSCFGAQIVKGAAFLIISGTNLVQNGIKQPLGIDT